MPDLTKKMQVLIDELVEKRIAKLEAILAEDESSLPAKVVLPAKGTKGDDLVVVIDTSFLGV